MNPEERARAKIDLQLEECGWQVQNFREMNIFASKGVAVREFPMSGAKEADYLLYADGKAIGVVEAEPQEWTLKGVEPQSGGYTQGLPKEVPAHRRPLPFGYETTGTVTQFTNALEPDARSREVFAFHRPEDLVRLARLERQTRLALGEMPPLNEEGLWPAQVEAITNLEKSFSENRPRSLIQMATGSGKTYTAVSAVYRLTKFGGAKHKRRPLASVRLERPVKVSEEGKPLHVDIWVEEEGVVLAIELKYKTRALQTLEGGERFDLRDQSAEDIGRYDFIKDVWRVETIVANSANAAGYAIMLTNSPSYWSRSLNSHTGDAEFRLHEGRELYGTLQWRERAGPGTRRGREQPLRLTGRYELRWADYSQTTAGNKSSTFRYLIAATKTSQGG